MRVFLHLGAGKTGTSAIQVALARGRDRLAAAGLLYPDGGTPSDVAAARGGISSGNAVRLAWLLHPPSRPPDFEEEPVWDWLARLIAEAGGRDLLFSSELLQSADPERAAALVAALRRHGTTPVGIFYLRHVMDHAVAVWQQHLTQGFATLARPDRPRDLGGFLRTHRCPFARQLETWEAALGPGALLRRLYDAERAGLVPGFLRGIRDGIQLPAPASEAVNRSPTTAEQPLFLRLAAAPDGPALCRRLSDILLNGPAGPAEPLLVDPEDAAAFEARNAPILARINRRFPPDGGPLELRSRRILLGRAEPPRAEVLMDNALDALSRVLRATPG